MLVQNRSRLTPSYRGSVRSRSPDHVFHFNLYHHHSVRPFLSPFSFPASCSRQFSFSGIYLQYTRHRTKPFKIPYIVTFGAICLVNLGMSPRIHTPQTFAHLDPIALSISVSIKAAGQGALCSVFSSFPSNQDCKWGGISIILPWVTTIFGECSRSFFLFR